jgi:ribosomal protein S19E (S16A)
MANRRFNKQVPGHGYKHGGQVNKSIVNRLEELGRVDAERGRSRKGIKNLRDEKKRIVRELMESRKIKRTKRNIK